MIDWVQNALSKLTIDEFERVIRKVGDVYRTGCKIVKVDRIENKGARVTVQLPSGASKLVII